MSFQVRRKSLSTAATKCLPLVKMRFSRWRTNAPWLKLIDPSISAFLSAQMLFRWKLVSGFLGLRAIRAPRVLLEFCRSFSHPKRFTPQSARIWTPAERSSSAVGAMDLKKSTLRLWLCLHASKIIRTRTPRETAAVTYTLFQQHWNSWLLDGTTSAP